MYAFGRMCAGAKILAKLGLWCLSLVNNLCDGFDDFRALVYVIGQSFGCVHFRILAIFCGLSLINDLGLDAWWDVCIKVLGLWWSVIIQLFGVSVSVTIWSMRVFRRFCMYCYSLGDFGSLVCSVIGQLLWYVHDDKGLDRYSQDKCYLPIIWSVVLSMCVVSEMKNADPQFQQCPLRTSSGM